ncbi:AraC family transcriptional regulator [Leptolyngbya sp. FACHB-261]|uniref:AraC family transcriptional regulator n=1 Tax=Leptolyngbya sp. FACHB-261 TaxID=2692806 RepID=UPI0016832C3F|nr:AraC family transcriptional regulator [Leptolyngbya sp. FACHB-261]MBD2103528.1 AraC family transcriptional regulator [Leptolyngbya sp. FACHB-261]
MKRIQDEATFWQDPELDGVEILHAHYVTQSFSRHTHNAFVISLIEQGEGAFWYRGSLRHSSAGSLGLLNPDEPHTGHVLGNIGWTYRALYVDPGLLLRVAQDIAERPWNGCWFPEPVVQDRRVAQSIRTLHRLLIEPSSTLERESALLVALSQLLLRHAERPPSLQRRGPEHRAVTQVREYIDVCYAENLSLQKLAALAQLNPFHLAQVFRKTVGLPPHAYLNQVRVARARTLIVAGEPIAQAAQATGFVDQSHLTRRFKQVLGFTPGQLFKRS